MMKAFILRCRPGSQFHFGKMALDENSGLHRTNHFFHSDTLFSALVNIVASFSSEAETDAVVALFTDDKVRISSGMFCLSHAEQDLFFLPTPAHFPLMCDTSEEAKEVQKISYISKGIWEHGVAPGPDWESTTRLSTSKLRKFAALKHEIEDWNLDKKQVDIFDIHTLPKVQARKLDQVGAFYFETNVIMPQNDADTFQMHYYFLLDTNLDNTNEAYQRLRTVIELLPDTGIGGGRSSGCGLFDRVDEQPFELRPYESEGFVTLGLTSPNSHQEIDRLEYYQTLQRGGRPLGPEVALRELRMIAEGAYVTDTVMGQIADIKGVATEKYLRYGMPILLPVHINACPPKD